MQAAGAIMRRGARIRSCYQLSQWRHLRVAHDGELWMRPLHTPAHRHDARIEDIRNIGIIAHVDAGKTTTTERMLYHSGLTKRIGNVDTGNTVTDFLDLERERGITIQSAAITFHWPPPEESQHPKTINLIDTPGHQDFRFEVDRCLPVLDGAVCIIDAVKGVEAHTERVWASAHKHRIPRLLYVNKLDREGASFRRSVLEVAGRLNGVPILCHIPWWDREHFVGVVDVIDRVGWRWHAETGKRTQHDFSGDQVGVQLQELKQHVEKAREALIEALAEVDEEVMERFAENAADISSEMLKRSIRRAIANGDGGIIPILAGASFRNVGVEPLLDAIVDYLPSPSERPDLEVTLGGTKQTLSNLLTAQSKKQPGLASRIGAVASVFKVFNHPKEGLLSFVRVYHGSLHKHSATWNTHMLETERPLALLQIEADRTEEISHLATGQIGAIKGLKKARTGDTLVAAVGHKSIPDAVQHMQIRPPDIPPAVAFLAIDPYGLVATKELQTALQNASREDPSLRWSWDETTEQFTLQGMGKLHLDIAVHNLKTRYKLDAEFGPIEVDYKECVTSMAGPHQVAYDKTVAGKTGKASCSALIEPLEDHHRESLLESSIDVDGNIIHIAIPPSALEGGQPFSVDDARQQLLNGALAALARGPRRGGPVQRTHVTITLDEPPVTPSGGHFSGAASRAVREALREAHARHHVGVLEPVMKVHISCPEESAGAVQHDITSGAGGQVLEVHDLSGEAAVAAETATEGRRRVDASAVYCPPDPYDSLTSLKGRKGPTRMVQIVAKVPLKEMLDYDAHLRSKTGGRHSMTMALEGFERVMGSRERGV